jgi:hypothetical protein
MPHSIRTDTAPTFKWVQLIISYFYQVRQSVRCLTDFVRTRYDVITINFVGKFWFWFSLVYLLQFSLLQFRLLFT